MPKCETLLIQERWMAYVNAAGSFSRHFSTFCSVHSKNGASRISPYFTTSENPERNSLSGNVCSVSTPLNHLRSHIIFKRVTCIDQDTCRLIESPDHVLSQRMIDTCLATDRRIHLGHHRRRNLSHHRMHPFRQCSRSERWYAWRKWTPLW